MITSLLIDKDDSGRATRVRFGDEVVTVPDGDDPDEFARRHAREHYGDRHVIHVRFVKANHAEGDRREISYLEAVHVVDYYLDRLYQAEFSDRDGGRMKLVVGLTGGIGSGKSSVGRAFERRGIVVIDADAISRALTAAGGAAMPAIAAAFGPSVVDASGALDRARMRAIAFTDPEAKRRLEGSLHPMIRAENDRRLAAAASPYVILMIPLLVESGQARARCDRILVVDVPEEEQIRRVGARDGLAREQILAIMAAQATRAARLAEADDVIENTGTEAALDPAVEPLHRRYLALAAERAAGR